MLKEFKNRKEPAVSFRDSCSSVCDDGCRRDAVISALWEQARHYGYGGRL